MGFFFSQAKKTMHNCITYNTICFNYVLRVQWGSLVVFQFTLVRVVKNKKLGHGYLWFHKNITDTLSYVLIILHYDSQNRWILLSLYYKSNVILGLQMYVILVNCFYIFVLMNNKCIRDWCWNCLQSEAIFYLMKQHKWGNCTFVLQCCFHG